MKTPEEFLSRGNGNFINCTDYDDAITAMQEFASQECQAFAEWIAQEEWIRPINGRLWHKKICGLGIKPQDLESTTSELYTLYLKDKEKK